MTAYFNPITKPAGAEPNCKLTARKSGNKKEMEGYKMTWKSKIVGITAALTVCAALALSAGLDAWW